MENVEITKSYLNNLPPKLKRNLEETLTASTETEKINLKGEDSKTKDSFRHLNKNMHCYNSNY